MFLTDVLSKCCCCFSTSGIEAPDLTSLLEQFEETQGERSDYPFTVYLDADMWSLFNLFLFFLLQQKRREFARMSPVSLVLLHLQTYQQMDTWSL